MSLKLVSFVLCPFVQRAVIALEEKRVKYELEYIDLADPPTWFTEISPFGKVPLLMVGEDVLFESAVILDYLDDVYAPRLHPVDPLRRAQHKAWIEFSSGLLGEQHGLCAAYRERLESFKAGLARLTRPLDAGSFGGEEGFSMVDAAFAPLFMRHELLCRSRSELREIYPEPVGVWADRLLQRPSVSDSVGDDFADRYVDFFAAKGSWLIGQMRR